ncbi:MAG: hypothetical protein VW576_04535 [Opitutae bacterium]
MSQGEQAEQSGVKKRMLARKKVQEEMDELRGQIRELRKKREQGQSVDQDIEACLGYLKVLKKEKDSIKEGSHTTFLSAKKYISPKFNYGSKKEELLGKIRQIAREIRLKEKELTGGGYDSDQRESLHASLTDLKKKHQEALLELKAIEQFNHTRFLEQKAIEEHTQREEENDSSTVHDSPASGNLPETKQVPPGRTTDFNPPPMI